MKRLDIPFNIKLLELSPEKTKGLRPTTSLDIFEGATKNFHPDGLFSTLTFGKVGDQSRMVMFSYIDIKIPIFHPVLYKAFTSLKALYGEIMSGKGYAVWDAREKDFVRSDAVNGGTGYDFFARHCGSIKLVPTRSITRTQNIELISKYKGNLFTTKVVVIPAGLRDAEIDDSGRHTEDEINTVYRKLIANSNTLGNVAPSSDIETFNVIRYQLQLSFNELYENLSDRIEGKKKLFLGKWASRRIFNGTRNVITSMPLKTRKLGEDGSIDSNTTVAGLYQVLKGILPIAQYNIRNTFLPKVFPGPNVPAVLVDPKSLMSVNVNLSPAYYDRWMTDAGIEKILTLFGQEDTRNEVIMVSGNYLGLIFDDGVTVRFMQDIRELQEGESKDAVRPITLGEFLYISTFKVINKYPGFLTRYPVAGLGSIYPSKIYTKTTVVGRRLTVIDETGEGCLVQEYPVVAGRWFNSLSPHPTRLAGLAADFDGDTASLNIAYSDESIKEIKDYMASKKAYVDASNSFLASVDIFPVKLVLHNLTGN